MYLRVGELIGLFVIVDRGETSPKSKKTDGDVEKKEKHKQMRATERRLRAANSKKKRAKIAGSTTSDNSDVRVDESCEDGVAKRLNRRRKQTRKRTHLLVNKETTTATLANIVQAELLSTPSATREEANTTSQEAIITAEEARRAFIIRATLRLFQQQKPGVGQMETPVIQD